MRSAVRLLRSVDTCLAGASAKLTPPAAPPSWACVHQQRRYIVDKALAAIQSTAVTRTEEESFLREWNEQQAREARALSAKMYGDPLTYIGPEESERYYIPRPRNDRTLLGRISWHMGGHHKFLKHVAWRFAALIHERLENHQLCDVFDIGPGFNIRCYFFMLHVWMLHCRCITCGWEGHAIDEWMFWGLWYVVQDWMLLRDVPEYRWMAELKNIQEYMYGFCVSLDLAMEKSDVLPARVREVLWGNLYSGEIGEDSPALDLLTIYVLRQLQYVLHMDKDQFLTGNFVWADFPVGDVPRMKVIPPLSQRNIYFGFMPEGGHEKYFYFGDGTRDYPSSFPVVRQTELEHKVRRGELPPGTELGKTRTLPPLQPRAPRLTEGKGGRPGQPRLPKPVEKLEAGGRESKVAPGSVPMSPRLAQRMGTKEEKVPRNLHELIKMAKGEEITWGEAEPPPFPAEAKGGGGGDDNKTRDKAAAGSSSGVVKPVRTSDTKKARHAAGNKSS
ncbi:unnamed protein product [Vitrella brassicaformis CCMP3155]|uniref:Ubiquinol-cytochrome c chaperone domain-containing protein n=2 Tax=Vitrella brassicaformis TaxID=1169539 RepID=A0A0G4EL65_VITBC|nr:unnamed protein product [Vitrella brassicaformis CCMP3155]|eukprot:CEL97739.1 unnamed protein product [Vitrella brassicaformis CCMP3155]